MMIICHLPPDEFQKLGLVKDGLYKRAEHALENVFDICTILNTDLNLGIPRDEGGILENNHIFTGELLKELKSMMGFRNILVHRYGVLTTIWPFGTCRST